MNYERIYSEFITDRREKEGGLSGYFERHHIIPRSLGGDDSQENIIKLTARDHVFAHALLSKIHGGPMHYAYWMMVSGAPKQRAARNGVKLRVSSFLVAIARERRGKELSKRMSGSKHHFYGTKRSEKVKNKISVSLSNKYVNGYVSPSKGRRVSIEERRAISERMKALFAAGMKHPMLGKKHTPAARRKISLAQTGELNNNYGKPLRKEHARKIGQAQIGVKNHAADLRVLKFSHEEKGIFIGYRSEFIKKYSLDKANVGRLVNKTQGTHKGWVFDGVAE